MVDAAKKGLELREEFGRGGTEVGVRTARRIIGNNISIDLVKKMYAYHERHQVDKEAEGFKKGDEGFPSAGYIALHLWGFDAGHRWSERKRNEINEQEKKNMDANNLEKRVFDCKELRYHEDEHGKKKVRGYAAVFNELSEDLGNFREKINPDAFNSVLDNDVVALLNHDMDNLFGRTSNGTVKLSVDERGLFTEIDMPNTQLAKDTIELMERGDISQMSFGFYVGQDSWNKSDAGNIRTIEEISRLVDISLVTIPAYPQTSASVRSLLNNIDKEEERKDNVQVRKNKLKMLKLKK
jgi:HK97 family phage prohead protease